MFNLAERWGVRPDGTNPVRHVERYREEKKERFLSLEELGRLGEAIRAGEADGANEFAMAALRLLIFTGARLGEILNLRWEEVDLEKGVLVLPNSKTGRKRIYLNPPALEVLKALPNIAGNPFVIVGHRRGAQMVNLQKPWGRVRQYDESGTHNASLRALPATPRRSAGRASGRPMRRRALSPWRP